ncbi:MAG: hypothetical protein JST54_16720 [Deltaproteobacteria bacterium]|nr:hypothetical protein [Deltaproteobacteria bacterium]
MNGLRKHLRKLRFLIWFALAFALFTYIAKPLKSAFWKPVDANDVCQAMRAGQPSKDRWGHDLVYDARIGVAKSAGPDGIFGTGDDLTIGCIE